MIKRAKEVFKKLEFGILEILLGMLMVIGLIGYFWHISADLDWIDHTISFIIFSYLFYELNITSILFGRTSKFADAVIVLSFFSLFFKDIISYTALNSSKFQFLEFVDSIYLVLSNNLVLTNLMSLYLGITGLILASIYLTKNIKITHPSLFYAICPKSVSNHLLKFLSIFILLAAFYYFVYNLVLEWLEFTLDDPVILAGIVFYFYKVLKHYQKFHAGNFIFKIGNFSAGWYSKFVFLFHYKKTLPLAISGLLVLHALSDAGVFAYSLTFLKENFYLDIIGSEHAPFFRLFMQDTEKIADSTLFFLAVAYFLNALSLILLLLTPVIVWFRMFSQKELHFGRILLFFVYSSLAAYFLLPGYSLRPLSEPFVIGTDINTISLLETGSILDNFSRISNRIVFAGLASLAVGILAYLASKNPRIRKELYAFSIIAGICFFAIYLYYFTSSLIPYFMANISAAIFSLHFLIGMFLSILLILSLLFYVGGFILFVYEIVMEYHKRKWSDPIDDGLVKAIKSIKKPRKRFKKIV